MLSRLSSALAMVRCSESRLSAVCSSSAWMKAGTGWSPSARGPPPVRRVTSDSHSSSSLTKRLWAWEACSSRKPRIREPASPKSEELKAVPMPDRGVSSPCWSWPNIAAGSPESLLRPEMVAPTALTVSSRPQKVPRRPRKISRPIR